MIRIIHVIGSLNNGGTQSLLMNIYRELDKSKIQFDFIIFKKEEVFYKDEIEGMGGRVYILPEFGIKNIIVYIKSFNTFFMNHPEYKIIHGHVRSTASIYLKIAKNHGIVTIAHSHSTSSGEGGVSFIKSILQFPIRYIADHLISCSKDAGEWLFGKKSEFSIINNAVNLKKYSCDQNIRSLKRKQFDIENKFVIGHVGRFVTPKHHEFLLDVFREVYAVNKLAVLFLIGDGDLLFNIKNKVETYGLTDNVIFAGTRVDIPELLQAMDVFVFPSLYEGLGISVIEAQAAGLHCVVSDVIPNEAFLTDSVIPVSLSTSKKIWVEEILKPRESISIDSQHKIIKAAGYDINEVTTKLEIFYKNSI